MPGFTLPRRRRIFLMRHGDVTYFDDTGRAIDPDAVPLNEQGRLQASAAGEAFSAGEVRFDRVIASGLPRTVETAERVLAKTGQRIEIETWPEWREIRPGRLPDLTPADVERAFLGIFDGIVPEHTRFLGGETIGELLDRVLPPLARLRADSRWDTVLLVLHGGVNRALLSHAIAAGARVFFGHLAQATGCINALDVGEKEQDWVVRAINYAPPAPLFRDVRHTTMEMLYAQYLRYRSDS
ncbi:histidine phosphatase family protein [Trinickia caryophylli]|uniref:Probable phosphoglycerate mutase n=1 Tax=Trinickia caryophylli TaxID=28094 RepID=A0A1X7GWP9_TRICW|nr:histidine phosphatase family protein [Trinickia caryophylli]PMS08675.1 histidine phosphatase family protein [Trinickia caryophylli]TRX18053.1 histidine phosphatase family protein [Trinickia caryophylli]WQE11164.1 histidine phosphatase family protein [Trinickia caryophylli]SMF75379.1 probable phosphoglycerate mutase [Trinickia caryophylli]GLU35325.1 phosphoglycerate mutase [Trinickia caryophylli]